MDNITLFVRVKAIRYFKIPPSLVADQLVNPVTRDLYLTEAGELEITSGTIWDPGEKTANHLL